MGCEETLYASWAVFGAVFGVFVALTLDACVLAYRRGVIDGYFRGEMPPVQRVVDEALRGRRGLDI